MDRREQDLDFEKTLEDSKLLLEGASRVLNEDYEFTLEGILEEYGSGKKAAEPPPDAAPPAPVVSVPLPDLPEDEEEYEPDGEPEEPEETARPAKPARPKERDESNTGIPDIVPTVDTPQSYTLRDLLERTVQDVLDEKEPLIEEEPRRGLFSRKKPRDTEELYESPTEETGRQKPPKKQADVPADGEGPFRETPPVEPEPPIEETVADYREAAKSCRRELHIAAVITALMWVPAVAERFGVLPAVYQEEKLLHLLPFFVALALLCVVARDVILYAVERLSHLRLSYELLSSLLCIGAMADDLAAFFLPVRAASPAQPLHAIAALAMTSALWGREQLFRALYDTFRVASLGEPPYMITPTAGGAAKRKGVIEGFSTAAQKDDLATRWQTLVLPVVLTAVFVFTALATMENKSRELCFWNFTAILSGANALAFPLVYALPLRRLTRRFTKSGGALAGYTGANQIRRSNCMILTDTDLFPRGTVTLNGLKIFGENSGKVISYAATMARATDSGLTPLFDSLLEQEGGHAEPLTDLNFYEEGGVGGTIHGESVLFGTSSFCRKMGVTLPHGLTLKTGMFLAVDGTLIAVFAVKYLKSENVDWALHALRRARLTPVLAVRDGNITPALLKRKFDTDAHAVYPSLSTRLALSEKGGVRPCALIYREGLMPYAELAVGSKRLCRAVSIGNVMTLIASVAGTMVSFYLSFVGAYTLFTPFSLLAYLLLWAVAALIDGVFVDKY